MPIERIVAGDQVWSCDLTAGDWRLCRVAETYVFDHVGDLVEIFVAGDRIESTYHHPYWVVEGRNLQDRPSPDHVTAAEVQGGVVPGRWVDAGDLQVGDIMLSLDGRRLPIEEILFRHVREQVYNLAVDDLYTYAVGPNRVLVHNNCGDILQTGGNTIKKSTAKALNENLGLNLHPREWGRALEKLKKQAGLPNNHHGQIDALGNYLDDFGDLIGDITEFLCRPSLDPHLDGPRLSTATAHAIVHVPNC